MSETQSILDLEALLDSTMDEVETAPDYVDPPSGQYVFGIESVELVASKTEGKPPMIVTTLKVVETLQLSDQADLPVPAGSLFSLRNNYDNKGLPYFKRNASKILGVSVDGVPLRDLFTELAGVTEIKGVVTKRDYKKDDGSTGQSVDVRFTPSEAAA